MNKDIPELEVKNVTVVVKPGEEGEHWSVHLVNENTFPIKDILVASKGYGEKGKDQEITSTIRQSFAEVPPKSAIQIELIDPEVFHLFNEYGVTYYIGTEIYFKKFVFEPDSILSENLVNHDILNTKVVLHD